MSESVSRRSVITSIPATAATAAFADARALGDAHYIEHAVMEAIKSHACPGVSVAIGRPSTIIGAYGWGFSNLETRTAVSERSIFRIGSLTKQFAAAAILKLAQMGRLDVHASPAAYLPSAGVLKPVTVMQLMNHTAGLHSDEGGSDDPTCAIPARTQIELAAEIARQTKPFDFDPGAAWLYSNANYIVLGAIIESITRTPFSQAMSELVFEPLGLRSLAVDAPSEVVVDRASGYSSPKSGGAPFENAAYLDVSQAGAAGAMRGSAVDLCRWHDALLSNELLDPFHLNLMLSPGRLRDGRLSSANRFSANDAHYGDLEYGCGLLVSGPTERNASILHYGMINGFSCVLQTFTKSRTTFCVLCNSDIGPGMPFSAIRKVIISRYLS